VTRPAILLCLLALPGIGCPRVTVDPGATMPTAATSASPEASYVAVETISRVPAGEDVLDEACGCRVPVPDGWSAWRVLSDPTSVVRMELPGPPDLRVEVHRGGDRVPERGEGFFDRGRYLNGTRSDEVVAVWSSRSDAVPGTRHMGVLLQDGDRQVVIEGWIPEDLFESSKRAFDALVAGTTFTGGGGAP